MSLRWAILGLGGIANVFAHDLKAVGLDLVAVAARDQDRANAFASKNEVGRAHGSYEALADDPEVDAVYISTPHVTHAEAAELMIRCGKHVLIEKPMAINAAQVRSIQAAARKAGVFAMEAMRTRFMPHSVRIRELIAEGAIGEREAMIADHNQLANADPEGRMWNPSLGGGALLDLGVYCVSFASDFMGTPTEIDAMAELTNTGVDRQTAMSFRYANGAMASLQTGMNGRGPNRAAIIGTEARIEVASVFYKSSKFQLIDKQDAVIEDFHEPYEHFGKQYEAWEVERCVAAGLLESPLMTLDESVTIHETMDEVRRIVGVTYPGEVA